MEPSSPQPVSRVRRLLRYLRVGFSGLCAVAAILLISLWVRSYSYLDSVAVGISSWKGKVYVSRKVKVFPTSDNPQGSIDVYTRNGVTTASASGLTVQFNGGGIPYWLTIALALTLGVAPWTRQLKWQFSLRTLLFAITLAALALGTIIATTR